MANFRVRGVLFVRPTPGTMPELVVAEEVKAELSAEEAKAGEGCCRTGWILGVCGDSGSSACCALGLLRAPEDMEPSEAATREALGVCLGILSRS